MPAAWKLADVPPTPKTRTIDSYSIQGDRKLRYRKRLEANPLEIDGPTTVRLPITIMYNLCTFIGGTPLAKVH